MAQSIATWLVGNAYFQAISNRTQLQLWAKLGIKSVEIPQEAEATRDPLGNIQYQDSPTYKSLLESDVQSIKIIRPSHMTIVGLCDDLSTLESIIASQKDTMLTLTVYTKSVIAENLIIVSVDFDQVPDKLSATQVTISLEQALPPVGSVYDPSQPADQSQSAFRVQQPNTTVTTISGLFSKVASKVTNVVKPIAGALLGNKGEAFILDSSKLG